MFINKKYFHIIILNNIYTILCQDNVNAVLAPNIRECFQNVKFRDRNNLQPMTLPIFLDLLRKIEDFPGTNANMRQLSTGLLHVLRQDGIVYDPSSAATGGVIPFKPTGFPAFKNRLLLRKLLPNNNFKFPSDALSQSEKCTLHHMISSTLALNTRGDEGNVCPKLVDNARKNARFRLNGIYTAEVFDVKSTLTDKASGNLIVGSSLCPIEEGVIYTEWGSVAAGTLIAGVSSGLEPQKVLVTDLVDIKHGEVLNDTFVVDNKYASTIAGDLAEASLRQGAAKANVSIGAPGSWNSTTLRKQYFLDRSKYLEMTDAEILADIDGLILNDLVGHYTELFPDLKLSQYIDMYYSEKGIFHDNRFRACNRQSLTTVVAPTELLIQQTIAFSLALNNYMAMSSSLTLDGINAYARAASESVYGYVASSLTEQPCPTENKENERPNVDLILVAEATIQMYPYISYVVEQIEVGKFGSCISLMEPSNGDIVIERTFSPSTFHEQFIDVMSRSGVSRELNLDTVVRSVKDRMRNETFIGLVGSEGGNSTVVVFLVNNVQLETSERLRAIEFGYELRTKYPDVHIIFATSSTSQELLEDVLIDRSHFFPIDLANMNQSAKDLIPMLDTVKLIPGKIINPRCGSEWTNKELTTDEFVFSIDAEGIKYLRVHQNYFYERSEGRKLLIQNKGDKSINVCYSRTDNNPRRNRTSSQVPADVTCESATAASAVEISLADACSGYANIMLCPPMYFSVSVNSFNRTPTCKEWDCRFPDDVKISIAAVHLGCFSNGNRIFSNIYTNVFVSLSVLFNLCFNIIIR